MKQKVIVLVSGGIDSPVAAALLARKYEIVPLHFCHYPFYCKGSFERMLKVMGTLKERTGFKEMLLVPWAPVLKAALEKGYRDYMCVICRSAMFKTAERIAKAEGAFAIATGEALAQKASQTLDNLAVTTSFVRIPIIRPLLGLDKPEIEEISKSLGLWSEEHVSCCSATPKKPKTKAKAEILAEQMVRLDIDNIISHYASKAMRLSDFDNVCVSDILERLDK